MDVANFVASSESRFEPEGLDFLVVAESGGSGLVRKTAAVRREAAGGEPSPIRLQTTDPNRSLTPGGFKAPESDPTRASAKRGMQT